MASVRPAAQWVSHPLPPLSGWRVVADVGQQVEARAARRRRPLRQRLGPTHQLPLLHHVLDRRERVRACVRACVRALVPPARACGHLGRNAVVREKLLQVRHLHRFDRAGRQLGQRGHALVGDCDGSVSERRVRGARGARRDAHSDTSRFLTGKCTIVGFFSRKYEFLVKRCAPTRVCAWAGVCAYARTRTRARAPSCAG